MNVLEVISGYSKYGKVTLGLNENEAFRLAQALFSIEGKLLSKDAKLEEVCQFIFEKLQISLLLVHPLDRSEVVTREGVQSISGRLVKKPRMSTGGGDNLNAGFCFAQMAGCNIEASTVLGMATSGAYVQDGQSPDLIRLKDYLNNWKAELEH